MSEDYLEQLPGILQYRGDHRAGEVEIVAPPVDDDEVEAGSDDEDQGKDPKEQRVKYGILDEDKYVLMVRDRVRFPGGDYGGYVRVINRSQLTGGGGTVMVPTWNEHVAFVRIFRHATRQWEWELPRGFQDPELGEEENALKEVKEELGVPGRRVDRIGEVKPNTGMLANAASVYHVELAGDPTEHGAVDVGEAISEAQLVPFASLDNFIIRQPITCGFSLSAIMYARIKGLL